MARLCYKSKLNLVKIGEIKEAKRQTLLPNRVLATRFGVCEKTIRRALAYRPPRESPDVLRKRKHSQRSIPDKIKTRRGHVKKLVEAVMTVKGLKYPKYTSCTQLRDALLHTYGISVCAKTICNDVRAMGYHSTVRIIVPTRDPVIIARRAAFMKRMKREGRGYTDWIIFSDEHVQSAMDYGDRRMYVKKGRNPIPRHRANPRNTPTFQVWGAIGYNYISPLIMFPKFDFDDDGKKKGWRLNAQRYVNRCLSPLLADLGKRKKKYIFMQDGAVSHTAGTSIKYLNGKMERIINWPPYSPDLNPIEHLWADMKRYVGKHHPGDADELKKCIKDYWNSLTYTTVNAYVLGFWDKMEAGLRNGGKPLTKNRKSNRHM